MPFVHYNNKQCYIPYCTALWLLTVQSCSNNSGDVSLWKISSLYTQAHPMHTLRINYVIHLNNNRNIRRARCCFVSFANNNINHNQIICDPTDNTDIDGGGLFYWPYRSTITSCTTTSLSADHDATWSYWIYTQY